MIEITENRLDELVENAEKMLRYGGKVMGCLDEMRRGEGRMGERSPLPDYRDGWREDARRRGHGYDDDGESRYGERYDGSYRGGGRRW